MRSKSLSTVFSKPFVITVIAIGVVFALAVMFVGISVARNNHAIELTTDIEYIKKQYTNYVEFNNTEEVKSLMRKAETAKLIKDCEEEPTQEHLKKHAEELAATGITILDTNCNVTAEYAKDGVGYESFKQKLNQDSVVRVMQHDNNAYVKRIKLDDESYVDVAIEKCSTGALLVYRHTTKEFAVKSILSIQNLLDGYDSELSTFVVMDGSDIIASNDKNFQRDTISQKDKALVNSIRTSGNADTMITVKKDGESLRYFGLYSHGREFYVCALISAEQMYKNVFPVVAVAITLYIFAIAVVQLIRIRATNKLIYEQEEQEHAYKLELESKNAELTKAVDAAESANRSKRVFLFNMSHDIRTPMNAIIGFTDLAQKNIDDKVKTKSYLDKIEQSSQHLLALINDVLDMSRIENGKVTIEDVPVCVYDQMQLVKDVVKADMDEKNLTYIEKTEVEHPYVYADALHVNRIIMNIFANAVKFTPEGGTVTFVLHERKSPHKGYAYFDFIIQDTGIGMSKEFVSHVFEQFAREKSSTVSHTQGTGLGMSITKSLVDLMKGDIKVQSELGKGTTFTVTLEFKITTKKVVSGAVELVEGKNINMSGKRLLLVEDNELNMEIAVAIFDSMGFVIEKAVDGSKALECVKSHPAGYYDLIFMDIQMPMMNGYEATKAIRSLADLGKANVPIVAMTANAFDEDKKAAFAVGMDGHIAKPISVDEIVKTLNTIFADK